MNELNICGLVTAPRRFGVDELSEINADSQINDVTTIGFRQSGVAVRLSAILQQCGIDSTANRLRLRATADGFEASVPLQEASERGVVIYLVDGQPLDEKAGGPFRFWIPNHTACGESELDACANVKFMDTIEVAVE